MPRLTSPRSLAFLLLVVLAVVGGLLAFAGRGGDEPAPVFNRTEMMIGTTAPSLDSGYQDWPLCSTEGRIENLPWSFRTIHWGPAAIAGASGCGGCGGSNTFGGNPFTAGMGLALAPPNDIPAGDIGQLPPGGHDHPYVMAGTAEVVLPIHLFTLSGRGGFDFNVDLTFRSGVTYSSTGCDFGPSMDASFLCYLLENPSTLNVRAFLGNWRVNDTYTWNSGSSTFTSPTGYFDKLQKLTRAGNDPLFPNLPYFKKTERCGVVWYFDQLYSGVKNIYGCTKIEGPWGNAFTFEYDLGGSDPTLLTKVTDTEGREMTFTRSSGRITNLVVSNSADSDYGNVSIDFTYSSTRLVQIDLEKTRLYDGQTAPLPRKYWELTWHTSGVRTNDVDLVKDCGTTVLDFDYQTSTIDRCTQVTDADGEVHAYAVDQSGGGDYWTEYTDPSGQEEDFVYTSSSDRITIAERRDYLEDETRADIGSPVSTTYTRGCGCGQITGITYSDGSEEAWTYDTTLGVPTEYRRISSNGGDPDLVKQWTYDTFNNMGRMLTTTGTLQATNSPTTMVTYAWSSGLLNTVTWLTVSTGQPGNQTIVWDYDFNGDGTLDALTQPDGDESEWSYSSDDITRTDDPGALDREWVTSRNKHGQVTAQEDPTGATVTYTVTPDGRVLKIAGANSQETKNTYDLRGRRTQEDKLLDTAPNPDIRVVTDYTYSTGSRMTGMTVNDVDGSNDPATTYDLDIDDGDRFSKVTDPDGIKTKKIWGYGSHALPWKTVNVATGLSDVDLEVLERDTMGRVTTQVAQGGTETRYGYDGYGRLETITTDLPSSATRVTTKTLTDWGAPDTVVVTSGATTYAITDYFYDEAARHYKTMSEDPTNNLADRTVSENVLDQNGRPAIRKDALGKEWETQWDAAGRVETEVEPTAAGGANEMQYAYDDSTRETTITAHEYDTDAAAYTDYVVVETHDASGRVTSVEDQGSASGSRITSYTYDQGNRRRTKTTPLGQGGSYSTTYDYDRLGRLTAEEKPIATGTPMLTAPTQITLTLAGRKSIVTDANSKTARYYYDRFGRESSMRYYKDGSNYNEFSKSYDSYGRLDVATDPMGAELTYVYDAGGRVDYIDVDKNSSGLMGPDRIDYSYDAMDRVTSAKTQVYSGGYSDITSVTRSYDGYGEMDSETQYGSRTFAYAYDARGRATEITFPSGGPVLGVKYFYDDAGHLDKVQRKLNTTVEGIGSSIYADTATFEYEGHRETKRTQANHDLVRTQTWTSFREPAVLAYKKASNSALKTGLSCYWDADGHMVARVRDHDYSTYPYGEFYSYNWMDNLTGVWRNLQSPANFLGSAPTSLSATYTDKVDYNLGKVYERDSIDVTPDGGSPTNTNYVNNGWYQYTAVGGVSTIVWDNDGHCTDYDPWYYHWTALHQLAEADPYVGTTREYTYDAFGRRVETKVGAAVNKYIYVGWHMVGEHDGTNWLWEEVPMPGEDMLEHLAKDTNDLDSDANTTEIRQYAVHTDFQCTVWGLSGTNGSIVERYRYREPYGDSYTENAAAANIGDFESSVYHLKRLHGGAVDKIAENYDLRRRWLQSESSTWLSRDPLGPLSAPNLYAFVLDQPLTLRDPSGLQAEEACPCGDCTCVGWVQAQLCAALQDELDRSNFGPEGRAWFQFMIDTLCSHTTVTCTNNHDLCPPGACGFSTPPTSMGGNYTIAICMRQSRFLEVGPIIPGKPGQNIKDEWCIWTPECEGTSMQDTLLHEMFHVACWRNRYGDDADWGNADLQNEAGSFCGHGEHGFPNDNVTDFCARAFISCIGGGWGCRYMDWCEPF